MSNDTTYFSNCEISELVRWMLIMSQKEHGTLNLRYIEKDISSLNVRWREYYIRQVMAITNPKLKGGLVRRLSWLPNLKNFKGLMIYCPCMHRGSLEIYRALSKSWKKMPFPHINSTSWVLTWMQRSQYRAPYTSYKSLYDNKDLVLSSSLYTRKPACICICTHTHINAFIYIVERLKLVKWSLNWILAIFNIYNGTYFRILPWPLKNSRPALTKYESRSNGSDKHNGIILVTWKTQSFECRKALLCHPIHWTWQWTAKRKTENEFYKEDIKLIKSLRKWLIKEM